MTRVALVLVCAFVVGACDALFPPQIDCGPLDTAECEAAVDSIVSSVSEEYPHRRVMSIEILNQEGHATVRLDDGTEIGFGERL
jgi:hypothetical protein